MEYFADSYEGTNGDEYKHNFFTVPQTLHLSFHVLIFYYFSMFFKNYSMVKWACDIYYNASLFSFLWSVMLNVIVMLIAD